MAYADATTAFARKVARARTKMEDAEQKTIEAAVEAAVEAAAEVMAHVEIMTPYLEKYRRMKLELAAVHAEIETVVQERVSAQKAAVAHLTGREAARGHAAIGRLAMAVREEETKTRHAVIYRLEQRMLSIAKSMGRKPRATPIRRMFERACNLVMGAKRSVRGRTVPETLEVAKTMLLTVDKILDEVVEMSEMTNAAWRRTMPSLYRRRPSREEERVDRERVVARCKLCRARMLRLLV